MATFTHRREGGDLAWRVGEKRRIEHSLRANESGTGDAVAVTVSSVACTIYRSDGSTLVIAGTGASERDDATGFWAVWYVWATAGVPAGDYTYTLTVTMSDTQILMLTGPIGILPVTSKMDRWVRGIQSAILAEQVKDAAGFISERQYRESAVQAVRVLSLGRPRRLLYEQVLAEGVWEYALPPEWTPEVSRFERIEYPVDDTLQVRSWMNLTRGISIDQLRSRWRFGGGLSGDSYRTYGYGGSSGSSYGYAVVPSAGQSARLYYTAPHRLDDIFDTVPDETFLATCWYAGALCLLALASQSAGSSTSPIDAGAADYRTKEQQYRACAKDLIERAHASWRYTRSMSIGQDAF